MFIALVLVVGAWAVGRWSGRAPGSADRDVATRIARDHERPQRSDRMRPAVRRLPPSPGPESLVEPPTPTTLTRQRVAERAGEIAALSSEADLHAYLDELVRRARARGSVRIADLDAGLAAIAMYRDRLSPDEIETLSDQLDARLQAVSFELDPERRPSHDIDVDADVAAVVDRTLAAARRGDATAVDVAAAFSAIEQLRERVGDDETERRLEDFDARLRNL